MERLITSIPFAPGYAKKLVGTPLIRPIGWGPSHCIKMLQYQILELSKGSETSRMLPPQWADQLSKLQRSRDP